LVSEARDSPGPARLPPQGVGFNGQVFDILKIRSLFGDGNARFGTIRASDNDPRVTCNGCASNEGSPFGPALARLRTLFVGIKMKVEYELYYIQNMSSLPEFLIVFHTLPGLLNCTGAC